MIQGDHPVDVIKTDLKAEDVKMEVGVVIEVTVEVPGKAAQGKVGRDKGEVIRGSIATVLKVEEVRDVAFRVKADHAAIVLHAKAVRKFSLHSPN